MRGKAEANYWQDSSLRSEQAPQSQNRDCFAVARNDVLCQLIYTFTISPNIQALNSLSSFIFVFLRVPGGETLVDLVSSDFVA